ncbi:hypothetical protein MKK64_05220 [Methylobacterium sp. E-025]|jgi:hypothetical protein|uniref:hypothetical protein n=1 Tax=unclassified Methylobacterium TaxID=2615210 RepID=UPI001FBA0F8F|nr:MULTISPECIES: hypothetical protein [unclassified Methylobacterium]MCJ2039886.1 hypothetical protein [Methylobacterium sp. J-059]MCJ2110605.1 hypothetical protein [Methylobacterium sp. E-025]
MDLALLSDHARTTYGADWQRPLARGLGPLHPDGARETIDDRLVRRWASGERPIPEWVGPALAHAMDRQASVYERRAALIRERAGELRTELRPAPEEAPEMDMRP